jgi:hypothetical protein
MIVTMPVTPLSGFHDLAYNGVPSRAFILNSSVFMVSNQTCPVGRQSVVREHGWLREVADRCCWDTVH